MAENHSIPETQARKQVMSFANGRTLLLDKPTLMGVLNVTPDSFSDGGQFQSLENAVIQATKMIDEGAAIIDIGGESTRPGAEPVSESEEISRVIPVIEAIRHQSAIPLSIDTYHAATAEQALEAGADIVNDISAMCFDSRMVQVVAESKVPVVLMHMRGTPRNMQKNPTYVDCVAEVLAFFEERLHFCQVHGISHDRVMFDPGIGFGKRLQDNLALLSNLDRFHELGCPLLVGVSRKSFIEMIDHSGRPAEDRLGGSIAAAVEAVRRGADILRVHDVGATREAIAVSMAIGEQKN